MGASLGLPDLPGTRHQRAAYSLPAVAAGPDVIQPLFIAPAACRISNVQWSWAAAIVGANVDTFTARLRKLSQAGVLVGDISTRAFVLGTDAGLLTVITPPVDAAFRDMAAGEQLVYMSDQAGAGLADPARNVCFDVQWL